VKGQYGEPWREPAGSMYEIASGMACVLTMAPYPDATAKRRRIIACVNAMDGIDDPAAFVENAAAAIDLLQQVHDALKCGQKVEIGNLAGFAMAARKLGPHMRSCIAKAKGGES
jgi:hypothetical protein